MWQARNEAEATPAQPDRGDASSAFPLVGDRTGAEAEVEVVEPAGAAVRRQVRLVARHETEEEPIGKILRAAFLPDMRQAAADRAPIQMEVEPGADATARRGNGYAVRSVRGTRPKRRRRETAPKRRYGSSLAAASGAKRTRQTSSGELSARRRNWPVATARIG